MKKIVLTLLLFGACFGVDCQITSVGRSKVDLVFLLDSSGSVGRANFEKEKQFVTNSLSNFTIGQNDTRVSLVTFSSNPSTVFNLNQHNDNVTVSRDIDRILYKAGATYTDVALRHALTDSFTTTSGDRPDAKDVLVVITDGTSTDRNKTLIAAKELRGKGVVIIAVGIGPGSSQQSELYGMASGSRFVLQVAGFNELKSVYAAIYEICYGILSVPRERLALNKSGAIESSLKIGLQTKESEKMCQCSCGKWSNFDTSNLTSNEIKNVLKNDIEATKKAMSVNKTKTSKYKRRKMSAWDDRVSSQSIGIVGVLLIIVPILLMIGSDVIKLLTKYVITSN